LIVYCFNEVFEYINDNYNKTFDKNNKFKILRIIDNEYKEFEAKFKDHIKSITKVKLKAIQYANNLLQYLLKNKLIIAGYKVVDWSKDYFDITNELRTQYSQSQNMDMPKNSYMEKLMVFILMFTGVKSKNQKLTK
jgi:hypothetical protein